MKWIVTFVFKVHNLTWPVEAPSQGDAVIKALKLLDDFYSGTQDDFTEIKVTRA